MKNLHYLKSLAAFTILTGLSFAGYFTREQWLPFVVPQTQSAEKVDASDESAAPPTKVIVSDQAQLNMGLKAKPLEAKPYWKTILVPGIVVDRPGLSDRGVTAPVTGVVIKIAHVPGDAVRSGDLLFTIRVLSESLHQTQTELFKATQDISLAQAQRKRLASSGGAVPESRLIEVDNQISRLDVSVKAYRQELQSRGFALEQIDGVAEGKFVREITVRVPIHNSQLSTANYEVQELKVDLGQQVLAGQTLCTLANHELLAVEGRAFRDETQLLERSVEEKWPVEVDFQEDPAANWGEVKQAFRIRRMSNTIDPLTRTFAFLMPLENESRFVNDEGRALTLWRFRPGQKVRLLIRVEKVVTLAADGKTEILPFVLPAEAVARDGPEAFVFTQNVNTFERKPVRLLVQDRRQAVIANDGSLLPGTYVVQGGAEQLNRMIKSSGASGAPKGYHIHADGSLHKNEE